MEPGAEIKFRLRFMLTRSLNLDHAGAFEKIKFTLACAVSSKTRHPKPARLIIYAALAIRYIGATLDEIVLYDYKAPSPHS